MPAIKVVFFRDVDGTVPMLDWLDRLPQRVKDKCLVKLYRLHQLGHELRRPEADILQNGIYELRVGFSGANYRMLYFFHGNLAAVITHGLVKERRVPPIEIERAKQRMRLFKTNPTVYSAEAPNE